MEKKIIHPDDLLLVACAAVGYGGGMALAEQMGYGAVMQFVLSMVVGLIITAVMDKLKQKLGQHKGNVYGVIFTVLSGAIMEAISLAYYDTTILEAIVEEVGVETVLFGIVPAIAIFVISLASFRIRRARMLKKFGDGSLGYTADEKDAQLIKKHEGINQRLDAQALKGAAYVKTKYGTYVGKEQKKQLAFLGIPYAQAPVGELRFKAPAALAEGNEIMEAKYFGASALQADIQSNMLKNHRQDEDCLYLNIWTTKAEEKNKPVLVYVPGGDINFSGGALPINQGENFVKANPDIIYVNFNYRLAATGVLDFSAVPGGEAYQDAPNLPLLDILQALRWIKENIAAFGGNPDNITLVTDNSGSSFVASLATAPKAQGLFRRVFLTACNLDLCTPEKEKGQALAQKLLAETSSASMQDLMRLEQSALKDFINNHIFDLKPIQLDGELLPTDIYESYAKGATGETEFVFAIPADELTALITTYGESEYTRGIQKFYAKYLAELGKDKAAKLEAMRHDCINAGKSEIAATERVLNLALYEDCSLNLAELLSKAGKKVRLCYWNVNSPVKKYGPNTVSLVSALLGNTSAAENYGYMYDKNLSDMVMRLLSNYVRSGNPDVKNEEIKGMKGVTWPLYTAADKAVLNITDNDIKAERDLL